MPNVLLDEVMPQLSDTQLRVLLVVVRSTLGWREGAGRRQSDWLSHRQLQARTGRSSAVVSRAVDALVRRGLLRVTDDAGKLLMTASQRSRVQGRLFYSLSPEWVNDSRPIGIATLENQGGDEDLGKADSTGQVPDVAEVFGGEESIPLDARENEVPADTMGVQSREDAIEIEVAASETRPQKLRTTKESGTKEKYREMQLLIPTSKNEVSNLDLSSLNLNGAWEEKKKKGESQEGRGSEAGLGSEPIVPEEVESVWPEGAVVASAEMQHFFDVFARTYAVAKPDQRMPPVMREDAHLLGQFVAQHGIATLEAWLPTFFGSSFGYVRRREWSLRSFLDCFFVLQAAHLSRHQRL